MESHSSLNPFFISLAGFTFKITFVGTEWPYFREKVFKEALMMYFRGFLLAAKPQKCDYEIECHSQNTFGVIINNRSAKHYFTIYEKSGLFKIKTFTHVSFDHFSFILRQACQELLANADGALFHSSSIIMNHRAYVFTGNSGAGKSTIVQLLNNWSIPLTDDMSIIKRNGSSYYVYQAPNVEKNVFIEKTSKKYKIAKICFLIQSKQNKLTRLTKKSEIEKLLFKQLYTETEHVAKQLPFILQLHANFKEFYLLEFRLGNGEEISSLLK